MNELAVIQSCSILGEYEVALPIEELTKTLDANEETLSTLLCYLENDNWIEVHSPLYDTLTIKCYGAQHNIAILADKFRVIESAVKHNISMDVYKCTYVVCILIIALLNCV